MAKGNFIEYVVSDNPNKYPNDGEQSGYLYEMVEDVTPEVAAQTPVITQIAENLGVTITTPSGTNKQILQGNNVNLLNIKNNAKKEGAYVWKKNFISKKLTLGSSYENTVMPIGILIGCDYYDSEGNYIGIADISIISDNMNDLTLNYYYHCIDGEKSYIVLLVSNLSGNAFNVSKYTDYSIEITCGDFVDFVVSDSPTAYPDGGEQGGYYWELYGKPLKIVT